METQFPLGHEGFLLRYFAFVLGFEEQVLVQLVFARPAMGEVPRSIPKCDFQSLFRLFSFPCYLLACVVLVWHVVQAKAGMGCETARRLGWGQCSFTRSLARALRYKTVTLRRLVYIYKKVLDFCFMLNLLGRFLQTISFFCIQISSILESQFNINTHFVFSRVDARDSGDNAEI